jgi:ABC-2 type transport system permease protein
MNFKLPFMFLRIGALNELQYRLNFFLQLLQSLIAVGVGLVGLALVFEHTTDLAGWSRSELLAVMGVHILMGGILQATIQPNMIRLMGDVQEGMLDFALMKPADSQLLVSVREFRVWQLVDVLVGGAVLGYATNELHVRVGWTQALSFLVAILLGGFIFYSFWLILTTGVFWLTRMDNIFELFNGLYSAGRWPVGIYPSWLRNGLTFLVPVAFAVTVPAQALTNRLNAQTLLLALGVAVAIMAFARWFWFFGLRHYSGASA